MTDIDDEPTRCGALTTKGPQCRRYAIPGTERCHFHSFVIPGRPSKLTPELQAAVIEAVVEGNYRETAAQVVGISKRTLYNWIARGEEHIDADKVPKTEQPYVTFLHALKSAEAFAEVTLLGQASRGGFGWQAQMTVLERKFPDRWGRRDTHKVEHTGTVKHELSQMSDQQLRELATGIDAKRAAA